MSESLEQGKRKLTAKDAITAGALGAVCIAIRFLFMLVGGVSPYVWFATHFIDAILIGPVFMLLVAKIAWKRPPRLRVIQWSRISCTTAVRCFSRLY